MRKSSSWRITSAYLVLIISLLLGLTLYITSFARSAYLAQLEEQLAATARTAAGEAALLLSSDPAANLQELTLRIAANTGLRLTLIAPDGVVLGDSAEPPAELENHAGHPEVARALRGERGTSIRHSASVGYDMLYVAVPMLSDSGRSLGVSRAELPISSIDQLVARLAAAIGIATALAAAVAVVLAVWLGRSIAAPVKRLTRLAGEMAGGNLQARVQISSQDEVGRLGLAFNRMVERVRENLGAMAAERNRLAAILNTMADGLIIVDADSHVLLLNPAAERMLGARPGQAIGRPFIEVARDHELAVLLAQPEGGSRLVELGLSGRRARAVVTRVPGSDNQRLLLLQDVTELRRLESVRRDFAANVSHELRTPLASMKAIVETLQDGALDDPLVAREFLNRLHGEVEALVDLVQELLELSRIESGQEQMERKPLNLETILRASAKRLSPLARRSGVDLRVVVPAELPPALGDEARIGKVIAGLLHNALKFTPAGGWVELRAEPRDGELVVCVQDSGVGIPPEDLERVFERFFKSDPSRASLGTGLGLAIARHVVEAHGGRIWAESDGVHGSTFSFTLPAAAAVQPAAGLSGTAWRGS